MWVHWYMWSKSMKANVKKIVTAKCIYMYKTVTLKANAKEIVHLKMLIACQICTKSSLCRRVRLCMSSHKKLHRDPSCDMPVDANVAPWGNWSLQIYSSVCFSCIYTAKYVQNTCKCYGYHHLQ